MNQVINGEVNTIEVPKEYPESIMQFAHQVVKGESVVTCRIDLVEPVKKIGEKVPCPGCGTVFTVVELKE